MVERRKLILQRGGIESLFLRIDNRYVSRRVAFTAVRNDDTGADGKSKVDAAE